MRKRFTDVIDLSKAVCEFQVVSHVLYKQVGVNRAVYYKLRANPQRRWRMITPWTQRI